MTVAGHYAAALPRRSGSSGKDRDGAYPAAPASQPGLLPQSISGAPASTPVSLAPALREQTDRAARPAVSPGSPPSTDVRRAPAADPLPDPVAAISETPWYRARARAAAPRP